MAYSTPRSNMDQRTREMADCYVTSVQDKEGLMGGTERTLVELFISKHTESISFDKIVNHVNAHRIYINEVKPAEVQDLLTRMARGQFIRRRMNRGLKMYEVKF